MNCIQVLYFAEIADITGTAEELVPLEGNDLRLETFLKQLSKKYGPRFEELLPTCMFAVNFHQASLDQELERRDELAILPPVSGG
ncbi:molybdopterin converting factor, subunit 1 [Gongronella butleri]|nr:molybdopterin converting factor, subunit 1 [Gongronella butleri]